MFGAGEAASETALSGGLTQTDRVPPLRPIRSPSYSSLIPLKKVITCSTHKAKTVHKRDGPYKYYHYYTAEMEDDPNNFDVEAAKY